MVPSAKPMLRVLAGERLDRPPWWLMRQAGRYLPEYRAVRARAGDFVSLCLNPELAAEVTLQPVRRYGMDAAILFSDILMIPHGLGQQLGFSGDGPVLEPIRDGAALARLSPDRMLSALAPVFDTVRRCRAGLPPETALIGFAGAPWTVAAYMVEGGGSKDFRELKRWAYADPPGFAALIDLLVQSTIVYLQAQIEAGAEIVQLFDSWAGVLPESGFERWVIEPTRRIAEALKRSHPEIPMIGFPRGAGLMYERYAAETGVDAVGLDTTVPPGFAAQRLQTRLPVQGNLDPILLIVGGPALVDAVRALKRAFAGGPFIFNLGHGVLPQTPPENVALVAELMTETMAEQG